MRARCRYGLACHGDSPGEVVRTRCFLTTGHAGEHNARWLLYDNSRVIRWEPGNLREFTTKKKNSYAWHEAVEQVPSLKVFRI